MYPKTFEETVGGKVVGSGCDAFTEKLYSAIQYLRQTSEDPNLRPVKRNAKKIVLMVGMLMIQMTWTSPEKKP